MTRTARTVERNFVDQAGKGCYIIRADSPGNAIEFEDVDPRDFEGQPVPDIALDPEERTLSLCNIDAVTKIAYITVFETKCLGGDEEVLPLGSTTDNTGETRSCLTFIVLCPPNTFVHLCYLDTEDDVMNIHIESDVQEWKRHPKPDDSYPHPLGFPLSGGPYLCTQGENGHLTHFFSGNLHAIDFRCAVGSPLLAVGDGVVLDSCDNNTLTGIAVSNLFTWNSILIQLDTMDNNDRDHLYVEYVHIQSSKVTKGDVVKMGDVIGYSGSVGFSPEPHLHFAAYRSSSPDAPTVRVRFIEAEGGAFLPQAGLWYSAKGEEG
jgi:hypothetical protein